MTIRAVLSAGCVLACTTVLSHAQSEPQSITIGVLNDMAGNFADQSGPGSLAAARNGDRGTRRQRAGQAGQGDRRRPPEQAGHCRRVARRWYDTEGVQLVVDLPNSGTALAVQEVARTLKKINVTSTAGSLALTGKSCSPTSFHWMWDTYSNSYGLVKALTKKQIDTWFFITADYAFGHALEADFRRGDRAGGRQDARLGQASGRHAGLQLVDPGRTGVKGARRRGGERRQRYRQHAQIRQRVRPAGAGISFVAPATFLTDVKSMGLDIAQGLTYITGFTWNYDDGSRAFARKFFERHKAMPTMGQAGVYSAVPALPARGRCLEIARCRPKSPTKCASCRSATPSSATARSGRRPADPRHVPGRGPPSRASRRIRGIWKRCWTALAGNDVFRPARRNRTVR